MNNLLSILIKRIFIFSIYFLFSISVFCQGIIYVNVANINSTKNGSLTYPYNSIQTALNNAQNNDTIKVAEGDYLENLVFPSNKSIYLYGGYQNGNYNNRNFDIYLSKITNQSNTSKILIEYSGSYGENRKYIISGFVIENGQRGINALNLGNGGIAELIIKNNIIQNNSGLTGSNDYGGGIYSRGMLPVIQNNIIKNNTCGKGAGFFVQLNNPDLQILIENNVIENNKIYSDHGAGAGVQAIKGIIRNNLFKNNEILEGWGWGGGLIIDGNTYASFNDNIYLELTNNIYTGNKAPSGGSGLFIDEGANVRIKNELLYKNISTSSGRNGPLYVDGPRANNNAKTIIENSTIADNIGADYSYGHSVYVEGGSEVQIKNSIFWNNKSTDNENDFYVDATSSLIVDYSIYKTGKLGDGNFTISNSSQIDPLFYNSTNGDYHLKSKTGRWNNSSLTWEIDYEHSPAIDAGNPSSNYLNEPSPNGNRINLGYRGNTIYASKSFTSNPTATYQVGPSRTYKTLQDVAGLLNPGDIVEVDGNHTYSGGVIFNRPGNPTNKIHIKGIRINGNRPIISGGTNTVAFTTPWPYTGPSGSHHYIFEGFEITGGTERGIFHQAKDLTIRDCFVRDCPKQGILGADQGSGSLLLEYTEVARCGSGDSRHQIYMATDQVNNPGSIFRMQHCFIHSGNGGNNVKSRAERNEIYYNWIEGAYYHELELIGADGNADGGNPNLRREDSDIVGNVLIKKLTNANNNPNFYVIRVGGDGTGESNGRYRFLNNTIICGTSAVFRIFDGIESVEIFNNLLYNPNGNVLFYRYDKPAWVSGQEVIFGSNNWVKTGTQQIPNGLTSTFTGTSPDFLDFSTYNLYPSINSNLVNNGVLPTTSLTGYEFPNPLPQPQKLPPQGKIDQLGMALDRNIIENIDIGAFEFSNTVSIETDFAILPTDFILNQNYPNPFNPSTKINFSIPFATNVKLSIYNMLGQQISVLLDSYLNAGNHSIIFKSTNLSTGIYIYELKTDTKILRKKMLLLK